MKISIIGAGNVGATAAQMIAKESLAREVVLLDVREGVAEGKAMDIMQGMMNVPKIYVNDTRTVVRGVTNDYSATEDSDIVIITSGVPRKPGMTREELIGVNSEVMENIINNLAKYEHRDDVIYIIVSNPMDSMTELVHRLKPDMDTHNIIGMGGLLDSARFKYYIREAIGKVNPEDEIKAFVVGGHGDTTMVPLLSSATFNGTPIRNLLSEEQLDDIVRWTMTGGATLTSFLGTSAWIGPAQAITKLVWMIVHDSNEVCTCSVPDPRVDICIGQFVTVGREGWKLMSNDCIKGEEYNKYLQSANAIRETNKSLKF